MAEKKEDLRIRRTHKLLCDAMFKLLETKSFDSISVVEICDKAMVHRATFYKHFNDKYDFMEYVTKEKIRSFFEQTTARKKLTNADEMYHAFIDNILDFIEENKVMLKISADSSNNSFLDSIQKIIYEDILNVLNKNGGNFVIPTDIISQFITGGFFSLIRWWIINEDKYSKAEMTKYLETILFLESSLHKGT